MALYGVLNILLHGYNQSMNEWMDECATLVSAGVSQERKLCCRWTRGAVKVHARGGRKGSVGPSRFNFSLGIVHNHAQPRVVARETQEPR